MRRPLQLLSTGKGPLSQASTEDFVIGFIGSKSKTATDQRRHSSTNWLRVKDSNLRPSAYETDELTTAPTHCNMATCTGIEPVFFCVTGRRINHFTNRPYYGGGSGIRTLGTLSRSSVFKTGALNHSAKPPMVLLERFELPTD